MKHDNHYYALIMAGGEGVRFRPLSTNKKPKQFINITDIRSTLLQQTFARISPLFPPGKIGVATNQRYIPLVLEQLPSLKRVQVIGETEKKNTAPCLAWATWQLYKKDKKAVVAALPADHFVTPEKRFQETLQKALELAEKHKTVVTLGISPTHPSVHYGYIRSRAGGRVEAFVEKPDLERAKKYLREGNYLWNSGIFVFPAAVLLEWISRHLPGMYRLLEEKRTLEDFFTGVEAVSIDYGVMEKAKGILVLTAPFTWSDVGTWENLKELAKAHSLKLSPKVKRHLDAI